VSPSNAPSSGRPRKATGSGKASGAGTDTQADDDTKPHTFNPAANTDRALPEETKPRAAVAEETQTDQPSVPLDKADSPATVWAERDQRATVHTPPPASNPYPAMAAYGAGAATGAPGGGYSGASPVSQQAGAVPRSSGARRARLKVSHLGPFSVMRVSLTFALCMFIVLLVAVAALWAVLDTSGVFKSIEDAANTLTDKNRSGLANWLSFGRVMLVTVVLGAANVIAFTLLSTIGALLYNLCSDFVGGVEVTLVER
jgi:hypothetical protein